MNQQFIFEQLPFEMYPLQEAGFPFVPMGGAVIPMEYGEQPEAFIKGAIRGVAKAAKSAGRAAQTVAKTATKTAERAASTASRAVPKPLAKVASYAARINPAAIGARTVWNTASAAARGENIVRAAKKAAAAGINDFRESMRFAEMVAPFVPGIGTGVAAALGAANALASGRPITEAIIAGARSALPGGAIAQAGFDVAVNLAKGKNISEAALTAARNRLPGGAAARAAFDTATALVQGKRIQEAVGSAAIGALPPSPYAANALSFAVRVAKGENIQSAALSGKGKQVMARIRAQGSKPSHELSYETPDISWGPLASENGRWVRSDNQIVLLGL